MKTAHNILIVEDEAIIAQSIKEDLEKLGHHVVAITSTAIDSLDILNNQKIDIVLLDISLKGEKNGIWIGNFIRSTYNIPFVYLTSHADQKTLKSALESKPDGYILKPFTYAELQSTIQIAYSKATENTTPLNDDILLKEGDRFVKVRLAEIHFIQSDKNYLDVHHIHGKTRIRHTIKDFKQDYPSADLIQIHRSFIVNITLVTGYDSYDVYLQDQRIPLGSSYKENFVKEFKKNL